MKLFKSDRKLYTESSNANDVSRFEELELAPTSISSNSLSKSNIIKELFQCLVFIVCILGVSSIVWCKILIKSYVNA